MLICINRAKQTFRPDLFCLFPVVLEPFHYFIFIYINGSTSTLFLSGSQQSGPSNSNFPLVLLLISTTRHTWDVTAADGQPSTLCCTLYVCVCERSVCVSGVKGAIHEQLAGVTLVRGRAAVNDWVYLCVCEASMCVCTVACPYVFRCVSTRHGCGHNKVSVWLSQTKLPWGRPFGFGQLTQLIVITGKTTRSLYANSKKFNSAG